MSAAIEELKVRARVRLNAARREGLESRLRDRLHEVAREVGFADWEHARHVLEGLAAPGDDFGTFWHSPRTTSMLNEWFADLGQARAALARGRRAYLLPYRRQFMLVGEDFIRELGLDPRDPHWDAAGRDLVAASGSPAWHALTERRVRALRAAPGDAVSP
ncbi:hypothetical protein [Ramlibacter humi]|uniref:Uncharacterized protein n=1 Tax=Ramlibacter humi TaxID=2530451 RepID=A0A4Z0C838_9BURK|nr:hypothetical protein [Ramlibacter humi]TFZ07846.1 hypothetical protein EZ216_01395 [Ramlibacter humi]